MVTAQDAVELYKQLMEKGFKVWLVGGWGIDALLVKQTREHHDIDMLVVLDELVQILKLLGKDGFALAQIWEEN